MRYLAALFVLLLSGCATIQWSAIPEQATANNAYYAVSIKPVCNEQGWNTANGCKAFVLTVSNKTASNLEIDWNKTAYIEEGQTNGGLMFGGIQYIERNYPKQPPDIIFPNITFKKTVWPNNLVFFASKEWNHGRMPVGENGIYLVIKIDGKEITERLTIKLSAVEE